MTDVPPLPGTLNYRDARQCKALIAELPLTNVPRVRDTLTRMLYGLRQTPPRSPDYLDVLEAMRAPLHFLQESLAVRYGSRPVIPGGAEDPVLRQVVALWLGMAQAYAQAAEQTGVHPLSDTQLALVCQRCVSRWRQKLRAVMGAASARTAKSPSCLARLNTVTGMGCCAKNC